MKPELDSVLDQSLSQMVPSDAGAGSPGVVSALPTDPAVAGELEPILRAAEALMAVPKPVLPAEAGARIESQLLSAAAANPRLRPTKKPSFRIALPRWRWAYSELAAIVFIVVFATAALVGISADALPGNILYPVKLVTENAWMALAPARSEPALHLRFAHRRLSESETLLDQGQLEPSVLEDMDYHTGAALRGLEDLPPALAQPLLEDLQEFTALQQRTLTERLAGAPSDLRVYIEAAIEAGSERTDQILELAGLLGLPELSGVVSALADPRVQRDTNRGSGAHQDAQASCDRGADAGADRNADPDRNADASAGRSADAGADCNADADAGADRNADPDAGADCNSDPDAGADCNADADPQRRRRLQLRPRRRCRLQRRRRCRLRRRPRLQRRRWYRLQRRRWCRLRRRPRLQRRRWCRPRPRPRPLRLRWCRPKPRRRPRHWCRPKRPGPSPSPPRRPDPPRRPSPPGRPRTARVKQTQRDRPPDSPGDAIV